MLVQSNYNMSPYSHHSARAGAGDEDFACVRGILADRVRDHVGNGVAVAAAIVGERRLGRDVPAASRVGRRRVDDNEAILVRQLGIWRARVVSLSGASAVVDGHNDWGLGSKFGRDVDEHLRFGSIITEVRDLGKSGTLLDQRQTGCTADERESAGKERCTHLERDRSKEGRGKRWQKRVAAKKFAVIDEFSHGWRRKLLYTYLKCSWLTVAATGRRGLSVAVLDVA